MPGPRPTRLRAASSGKNSPSGWRKSHQVESKPEWPQADYFKVRGADKHEYLLKHDLEADEWFLGRRW